MGLLKVIALLATGLIGGAAIAGSNKKSSNDKLSDPTKLGGWNFVDAGSPDLPLVVLLADIAADKALELLGPVPAHFVVPLPEYLTPAGQVYADPAEPNRVKAELDIAIRLSAFAASAMLKWSPNKRIVVAGLGRLAGTLAAVVALGGSLSVRAGVAAGFNLDTLQVPLMPSGKTMITALTWPPDEAGALAAAEVAKARGFGVTVNTYDGEGPPPWPELGEWLGKALVVDLVADA